MELLQGVHFNRKRFASLLFASSVWIGVAGAQDMGYIKAYGFPSDAGVFINGQYIGPAHRFTLSEKYSAPAGEVEVTFKDPRYDDYMVKVNVQAHKTTKIKYTMKMLEPAKPPFGRLRLGGGEPESFISVAAGDVGAIYLNNRFYGYVDELNNVGGGLLLNPGTYDLHVVSQKFGDINQKVTIEANKVTVIPLPQAR
jgi:PEGA domain